MENKFMLTLDQLFNARFNTPFGNAQAAQFALWNVQRTLDRKDKEWNSTESSKKQSAVAAT